MKPPAFFAAIVATGLLLTGSPLHSQQLKPTSEQQLKALKEQNQKLIEQQAASLEKLDAILKDAQQLRVFSRRS